MDLKWKERDSFFTVLAQGLNQLLNEEDDDITVELLREICYRYASRENWVQKLFKTNKQEAVVEDDDDAWNRYLFLVQFSANDVEKLISSQNEADKELLSILISGDYVGDELLLVAPTSGTPEMEGRILCHIYNFDLQIQGRIYDSSSTSNKDIILIKEKNSRFQFKKIIRKSISFKAEHFVDNKHATTTPGESTCLEEDFVDSKPLSSPVDLRSDEKSVNERLNKFVLFFVNEFEAKLQSYIDIISGKIDYKIDIFPNTFSSRVGHVGGGLFGGIVGGILGVLGVFGVETGAKVGADWGKELAQLISKIYMKEKTKSLWILIEEYRLNQPDFRQLLIEVGFDIFQSFEKQFTSVTSVSGGADEAMHLLARDAMNRVIYYVKSGDQNLSERGCQLRSVVVNGVILGKSKLDAKNLKIEGFQLTSGWKDVWRTKCIYEQVGVVHEGRYYKAKSGNSNTSKYGHRRLLSHEKMEKLEKQLRLEKDESSWSKYEYKVSSNKMKEFVEHSLSQMKNEQLLLLLLDKKRRTEILVEAETDMEDVKIRLKEAMTKMNSEQLEKLSNFETTLANLNVNHMVQKLDLHLEHDQRRSLEMEELLREKNEQLNLKLDEINTNVKLLLDKSLKR